MNSTFKVDNFIKIALKEKGGGGGKWIIFYEDDIAGGGKGEGGKVSPAPP